MPAWLGRLGAIFFSPDTLELVLDVYIAGTGPPLKLEIATVEHGATESDPDYVIQFVVRSARPWSRDLSISHMLEAKEFRLGRVK
jgi:hypothetical protein